MDEKLLLPIVGSAIGVVLVMTIGMVVLMWRYYRRVPSGHALIVTTPRGPIVVLEGGILVYPVVNQAEVIDLSFRAVPVEVRGVRTKDEVCVDVSATFRLRVNATTEDIQKVAKTVGCARAGDAQTLLELFGARCAGALTNAIRMFRRADLNREELAERALERLGPDLDGYVADGVGIESISA